MSTFSRPVGQSSSSSTDPPPVPPRKRTGQRDWLEQLRMRLDNSVAEGKAARLAAETAVCKSGMPTPPVGVKWRTVDGVRAAGFNPGRHVWYIQGRPVAASCPH